MDIMNEFHFSGKVVVITAGSSPLGQALILEFVNKGAQVITLVDFPLNLPCKQFHSITSLTSHLESLSKIDIIINILPESKPVPIDDLDYQTLSQSTSLIYHSTKSIWKTMRKHKHGHLLLILPEDSLYNDSSSLINSTTGSSWQGLFNTLKREGAKFHIRTNTLIYSSRENNENYLNSVVPLALFMTHSHFSDTGTLVQVQNGRVARVRVQRGTGKLFEGKWDAESVAQGIEEIKDEGKFPDYPVAYSESLLKVFFINLFKKPRI